MLALVNKEFESQIMKYVEDFLENLASKLIYQYTGTGKRTSTVSIWDAKFVQDVSSHTLGGSALSEAQAEVALKIIQRYTPLFDHKYHSTLASIYQNPTYRNALVRSDKFPREVRWAGGSMLLFRSTYNSAIIDEIKSLVPSLGNVFGPRPVPGMKMWKVFIDTNNYKSIMNFIRKHNFDFDQEVLEQFLLIENEQGRTSKATVQDDNIVLEIKNDMLASVWLSSNKGIFDV